MNPIEIPQDHPARKELAELRAENARLRELGDQLRASASMIGYVQCGDDYLKAERRIKAWDEFTSSRINS